MPLTPFPHRHFAAAGADGTGAAKPVLDAEAIDRLRALDPDGRRGFVLQVLKTYESSLVKHLARLAPADGARVEPRQAGDIAHTLKSSSASVGALAFSAACARLERAAKVGDSGDFVAALQAVRTDGEAALAAVRAMLQR